MKAARFALAIALLLQARTAAAPALRSGPDIGADPPRAEARCFWRALMGRAC